MTLPPQENPRWLNHPVLGEVSWPDRRCDFLIDGVAITCKPSTHRDGASLHIDLAQACLREPEAATILSRALSLAIWFDGSHGRLMPGWSGTSVPVQPPRHRDSPTGNLPLWPYTTKVALDARAKRALAHFREGKNCKSAGLNGLASLSFYKVVEGAFGQGDGKKREKWLSNVEAIIVAGNAPSLKGTKHLLESLSRDGRVPRLAYRFWQFGRNATAHAARDDALDPDDWSVFRKSKVDLPPDELGPDDLGAFEYIARLALAELHKVPLKPG